MVGYFQRYRTWLGSICAAALGIALAPVVGAQDAESTQDAEIQRLKGELETMGRRIEELEARKRAEEEQGLDPSTVVTVGEGTSPKAFKIPGTDTSLSFGGYAKLDAIYNSRAVEGPSQFGNQLFIPGTIPLDADAAGERDEINLHAKESRLWFHSYTPTDWAPVEVHVELDIFNLTATDSERVTSGFAPRLRHAYGKFGNLLAGQYWSAFQPVYTFPETNDFGGPAGQVFVRQPQIRWTQPTGFGDWFVSLENPETSLDIPAAPGVDPDLQGTRAEPSDDLYPDIVGGLDFLGDWGQASAAVLVRNLRADGEFGGIVVDDDVWGGAVSAAAEVSTFGEDYLSVMAQYGNAIGRYMSYNFFNGGVIEPDGEIDLTPMFGGNVGYTHYWTPTVRSTLLFGYAEADNSDFVDGTTVNKDLWSGHVNLLWNPVDPVRIGIEYLHAKRTTEDEQEGELDRVQLSFLYEF
jgi:hypothetical protein